MKTNPNKVSPGEEQKLFFIGPYAYYVFDLKKGVFTYIDDSIFEITGITAEEFINKSPAQTFGEIGEISHLEAIDNFVNKALNPLFSGGNIQDLRVNLIYNIFTRDKKNKRIHFQYVAFESDGTYLTKGYITDITHIQKEGLPYCYLIRDNKIILEETADPQAIIKKSELPISRTEVEILRYTALGHSPQEIADEMKISVSTLYTHRKNIKAKMGKDINYVISLLREKGILP